MQHCNSIKIKVNETFSAAAGDCDNGGVASSFYCKENSIQMIYALTDSFDHATTPHPKHFSSHLQKMSLTFIFCSWNHCSLVNVMKMEAGP